MLHTIFQNLSYFLLIVDLQMKCDKFIVHNDYICIFFNQGDVKALHVYQFQGHRMVGRLPARFGFGEDKMSLLNCEADDTVGVVPGGSVAPTANGDMYADVRHR